MTSSSRAGASSHRPSVGLQYGVAIVSVAIATVLRETLDPLLGNQVPYIIHFLAVLITAWYGGFGPGLVAIVLSSFAVGYFFVPPRGALSIRGSGNFVGWLIFLIVSLAMIMLAHSQRRERRRAEVSAQAIEAHLENLEREMAERARFERRLRDSEARFRALVDGAPMGVVAIDQKGRIVVANEGATDLFGYSREEMTGKRVETLMPERFQTIHSEHRSRYLVEPRLRQMGEDRDLVGLHQDGREFPIEVALNYVQTGDELLALAFISDITERKQREDALRESEERFRQMANSAPVMIWVSDPDGMCTFLNQSWYNFTGGSPERDLGHGWVDAVHPDDAARCVQAWEEAFAACEPYTMEYRLRRHDGEYCWVLDRGIPRFTPGGKLTGFIGTLIEIDDLKRSQQAQAFLVKAGEILSSSLDYETTLGSVARLAVPHIADWSAIDLVTPDGIERVAVAHADPAKIELARDLQHRFPPDPNATTGVTKVLRTGKPEVIRRITPEMLNAIEDAELREILHGLGLRSIMTVPLATRGHVNGALTLVTAESRRSFNEADLELAGELAHLAALAVDNAKFYRDMNEQRQRLHVTLSSIGDAVIATDASGKVTFMNGVAESLTGWEEEQAIDKPIEAVFPLRSEKTGEPVENPIARVLREGQIVGLANHTLLITRNGFEIPIDDSGAPIKDETGELVGAVLVFRDITARREAQNQIEESLERTRDLYEISRRISALRTPRELLEALVESRYLQGVARANIVLFEKPWDGQGHSGHVEIAASWNADGSMPMGETYNAREYELMELYTPDKPVIIRNVQTDPRLSNSLKELFASFDTYSMVLYPLVAAGYWYGMLSLHWAEPYSAEERVTRHIQGLADQIAAAVYNSRLLESEAEARRAAEDANKLKLKFLAMISHELRTPLTSIQGFASTLLAEDIEWDVDSQRDFIRIISEESDKLTDLISQLLDLSRLEAGMLAITPEQQPLDEIVDAALPQLSVLALDHQLEIDIPGSLPPVYADANRVGQVLSNLVGNAARYAPPQTRIRVEAEKNNQHVCVRVVDEGPGIPYQDRERVFEAFRQAADKKDNQTKGAGLGLAIARGLVEAHHGRIWIEESAGPGTTVAFSLPVGEVEETPLDNG